MKHPTSGEFMMPVPEHLKKKAFNDDRLGLFVDGQGTLWITGPDMGTLTDGAPYYIVNDDFDPVVSVDYEEGVVQCHERGGWSRTLTETFADLGDLAVKWGVELNFGAPTLELAEVAYKLIYAQQRVDHGLDPADYLPVPPHEFITLAPLPEPGTGGAFTEAQMLEFGKACAKLALEKE